MELSIRAQGPPAAVSFVVALIVRSVSLLSLLGTPFTRVMVGDSLLYLETADRIRAGQVDTIGVFFQSAPAYPFFLAAVESLFGGGWLPVAVIQSLLGSLACAAVALLAGAVWPHLPLARWAAGIGAAVYGPMVFHDLEVLPASLAVSLLTFGLLAAVRCRGAALAAAAGLLLGTTCLLAPAALLIVGLAGIIVGWPLRDRAARVRAGALALGALVAILPATAHNLAAGDTVLIAANAGVNLFIGNHRGATGAFVVPSGSGLDATHLEASARERAEEAAGRPLRPSEVSAYWARRAGSYLLADPSAALGLIGHKLLLAVNRYEIPNHLNVYFVAERFAPSLLRTLPFAALLPLGLVGIGLGAGRFREERRAFPGFRAWLLVSGASLSMLAVPVIFFVTGRYRLPAAPGLLALAGGALAWLLTAFAERRWGPALVGTAAVLLLWAPTQLRLVEEHEYSFDHLLLGKAYRELGDLDAAVLELKLAEETGPPWSDAPYRLAQVLAERGNLPAAAAALRRYLERNSGDREAAAALQALDGRTLPDAPPVPLTDFERGKAAALEGDWAAAARALQQAVERDPTHVTARTILAVTRERQGNLPEAIRQLEVAVRLQSGNPLIWRNLAAAYYKAGRKDDAARAAREAVRLAPEDPESRSLLERIEGTGGG